MLVQFLRSVSKELDKAATIDGCNSFMTHARVIIPIIKHSIITAALFQFILTFTDFEGPLIQCRLRFNTIIGHLFFGTEIFISGSIAGGVKG